ncbi:MAG: ABC transporter substrate-binding protein [Deltaproteobacteria bacterium]|nr:ABC transporter substrate-binding protein [Deltaproteobacteria bacterium]
MKKFKLGLVLGLTVVLVSVFALPGPAAAKKQMWRWGCSNPGAYGYRVSAFMSDFLRRGMPDYDVTVYPYVSTTANIKSFLVGELESTYSAEPGLRKLYSFTKPFKGFEPNVKQMPVQSFWAYTMETHILTLPKNKDKFRTWQDLDGKKIYMTKAGYMNHINIFRAMTDINGLKIKHVEVDMSKVADALRAGTIDAVAAYTTALVSLASWIKVLDVSSPLQGVNPTPEQIKKLTAAGFTPEKINMKKAYTRDLGVDELYGVPFYFGYHHGLSFPAEGVYKALKVFEAAGPAMIKIEPGFGPLAKDFAGFQVKGIQSIPEVPVHPGLAKYLKEKGLWDSSWKIATEETIKAAIKAMKAKAQ